MCIRDRPGNASNLKVEAPTNDNNFIAQAGELEPSNNIFLINQDNSQKSSPLQIQGGDTIVIGGNTGNPIDAMHKYAVTTALQTA